MDLQVPYQLRSADGLRYPFRNYVRGYTGLLDYVWFEPDRLEVQAGVFLPTTASFQAWPGQPQCMLPVQRIEHRCHGHRDE